MVMAWLGVVWCQDGVAGTPVKVWSPSGDALCDQAAGGWRLQGLNFLCDCRHRSPLFGVFFSLIICFLCKLFSPAYMPMNYKTYLKPKVMKIKPYQPMCQIWNYKNIFDLKVVPKYSRFNKKLTDILFDFSDIVWVSLKWNWLQVIK
jgi:hypothetical protein